ncbi:hypothetical protein [Nonomuraea sp. NPDC049709]|uniref:hypothetical protein n=1 Tax=Nonomuraea sp. NPDC049709 TaxID=3154736 RepID=UPI0034153B85
MDGLLITAPTVPAPVTAAPPAVPAAVPAALEEADVVAALRLKAAAVIDAELARLRARIRLDPGVCAQVDSAAHQVVELLIRPACQRLLAQAGSPAGARQADALARLFALDTSERAGGQAVWSR